MLQAPIYSSFNRIYPGKMYTKEGLPDNRVWFYHTVREDVLEDTFTVMLFPYGGEDDEVEELIVDNSNLWTS